MIKGVNMYFNLLVVAIPFSFLVRVFSQGRGVSSRQRWQEGMQLL